jgi:hypothetical protein
VAKRYTLVEGDLYRRGANDVLMQCITREDDCELLLEIHGGECTTMLHPAHWSVKPSTMASTGLQPSKMTSSR